MGAKQDTIRVASTWNQSESTWTWSPQQCLEYAVGLTMGHKITIMIMDNLPSGSAENSSEVARNRKYYNLKEENVHIHRICTKFF